jgi:hypothetical protein
MRNKLLIAVMALIMTSPLVLAEETDTTTDPRALSPAEMDTVKGGADAASASSGTNQQNFANAPTQQESAINNPANNPTTTPVSTITDTGLL